VELMKYVRDIFDLKENKKYKLTIIFLVIVIFFLQISMITTVKKTVVLVDKVRQLNSEVSELKASNNININKELYSMDQGEEMEYEQEENNKSKDKLISEYAAASESVGKKYNSNIITGNKIMVFEAVKLEMTENQIKKTLTKISSEEFGIEIDELEIYGKTIYKIYLIENPGS